MFGLKRLAKRSIIGSRICAPGGDGYYYQGTIQAAQLTLTGKEVFTVLFENGQRGSFTEKDIVGHGFRTISSLVLKPGQKVYVTNNGREVGGIVSKHDVNSNQLEIAIKLSSAPNDVLKVVSSLDEVRLMESRKSARQGFGLSETGGNSDYQAVRSGELPARQLLEHKKRPVSKVIDVPIQARKHRLKCDSHQDVDACDRFPMDMAADIVDEHVAAMALTALSCSPVSPCQLFTRRETDVVTPTFGSSLGSSGLFGVDNNPNTPSPPLCFSSSPFNSSSAPANVNAGNTLLVDEGFWQDEADAFFGENSEEIKAKRQKAALRTVFKCTWPGCGKTYNTCPGIEQHVRQIHLGKQTPSDCAEHEEEFYYTEIEVNIEAVTQAFADLHASSPPDQQALSPGPQLGSQQAPISPIAFTTSGVVGSGTKSPRQGVFETRRPVLDHDYNKESTGSITGNYTELPSPIFFGSSPQISFDMTGTPPSLPWSAAQFAGQLARCQSKLQSTSPKTAPSGLSKNSPLHKKSRSDVRKCRKVYGMENRDMWCTQCKWKKACTRYLD